MGVGSFFHLEQQSMGVIWYNPEIGVVGRTETSYVFEDRRATLDT